MDVSRYVKDKDKNIELKFTVEFVTPCFLGGANGNAEIRVAPFKNLIRRWWRIVNGNLSPEELWQKESELFGSTEKNEKNIKFNKDNHLTGDNKKPEVFGKSKVELRIDFITPSIPECYSTNQIDIGKCGYTKLATYIGYGAVSEKSYVVSKTKCYLTIQIPKKHEKEILSTLFAIHLFGTIGSKSRNGFGSISISGIKFMPEHFPRVNEYEKLINDKRKYPQLLGKDEKGILCWCSEEKYSSWQDAFNFIGTVYRQLVEDLKKDDKDYKTKWRNVLGFATENKKFPSELLLKVCASPKKTQNGIINEYFGQILIIPYLPDNWNEKDGDISECLKFIIDWLDETENLKGNYGRKIGGSK